MTHAGPRRDGLSLGGSVPGCVDVDVAELDGRTVVRATIDPADRQGALAPADGELLRTAAATALDQRLPLILSVASSGADITAGVAALHAWGRAARVMTRCSGVVPMLFAVTGPAVSGPALLLGLADQVVFVEDAYAFVSGPTMIRDFTGVTLTNREVGGVASHVRSSGVASLTAPTAGAAMKSVADILSFLPDHTDELPPRAFGDDPPDRPTPEVASIIPDAATGSYDVRSILVQLVDDEDLLELRAGWAPNLVTALARLDGQPVGIVANQPTQIAGTLDIPASQKGARFVAFCDSFNIPLITVIDTPGFYPGKDLEWRGMIRHGAQMAFTYARATVPRISLTLRKSYGGAYIVMDSRHMGNDLALAWPGAEIAVMGAKGAIEILHRDATPAERAQLEADYEQRLLNPYRAAERGSIDDVIDPAQTRATLTAALGTLAEKREPLRHRTHDNSPL